MWAHAARSTFRRDAGAVRSSVRSARTAPGKAATQSAMKGAYMPRMSCAGAGESEGEGEGEAEAEAEAE